MTDAGFIPRDWSAKSVSSISTPVRGGSPRPAGNPRYFNGSFIPWLTVASLTNIPDSKLLVSETASCLTEEGALHSRTLLPGTLIIANSGATLGVAKILEIRCCANDGIAALLSLDKEISPHYLAHYINTQTNYLRDSIATGNGQPNLNTELIGKFIIPLPPTKIEQLAIAEALSDADAFIESLEQLIAKKRQIKQAAMQELLTGRKRLDGFTDEWTPKPLGKLFYISGGLSASRDQLGNVGYCYLHYGDIHTSDRSFIDVASEFSNIPKLNVSLANVSAKTLLEDGDVVFVDASEDDEGTSKYVVIDNADDIPFISGLHTIVAKRKTEELEPIYLRYCFQSEAIKFQFKYFAVGTKVSGVSKGNIVKIVLPVPTRDEQLAIGAFLSDIDSEISALETKLGKVRGIKRGMMQDLLTGKIRLVESASSVIQIDSMRSQSSGKSSGHNEHFNEAVIIGVLTKQFGSNEYPLGRKRRTKFAYLLHRHCEGQALGFMKKAAGPYNPTVRYGGAEQIAINKAYVQECQSGSRTGFVAGNRIAEAENYFIEWYGGML
ncbi:MAG: restriction endonuclease subunit S [Chloracidobacterium sp.]|nr:restriction endonuclease subunit S [Chloracidobacterium sp.]